MLDVSTMSRRHRMYGVHRVHGEYCYGYLPIEIPTHCDVVTYPQVILNQSMKMVCPDAPWGDVVV